MKTLHQDCSSKNIHSLWNSDEMDCTNGKCYDKPGSTPMLDS